MPRHPHTDWHTLNHDEIEALAENLWRVEGDLPHGSLRRCMVVARLRNRDLVLHSAIAMNDDGMAALEALGRPAWMVVPNGWHRLDAAKYKARYPDLKVLCPPGARKAVERVVSVHGTTEDVPRPDPSDDSVCFEQFGGRKKMEGAMIVRSTDGRTAVFGDSLFNIEHGTGLSGFILKVVGSSGGPRVTALGRLFLTLTGAKKPYRAWLEAAAHSGDVVRLVPGHGSVISEDASQTLARVAASL